MQSLSYGSFEFNFVGGVPVDVSFENVGNIEYEPGRLEALRKNAENVLVECGFCCIVENFAPKDEFFFEAKIQHH